MPIIQVTSRGWGFCVVVDGVVYSIHETRGEAVRAALDYKENHS